MCDDVTINKATPTRKKHVKKSTIKTFPSQPVAQCNNEICAYRRFPQGCTLSDRLDWCNGFTMEQSHEQE